MAETVDPGSSASGWTPILETLAQGLVLLDPAGGLLEANAAARRMLRRERADGRADALPAPGCHLLAGGANLVAAGEYLSFAALRERVAAPPRRLRLVWDNGDTVWLQISVAAAEGGRLLVAIDDVSEQQATLAILDARGRIVDRALAASLPEVLRATLDEAEHLTGSRIGFFHFVGSDEETIMLQAWSTRTAADACRADGEGRHYPVSSAGVWADALRERRPVVHNEFARLAHRRGLPDGHAEVTRELVAPVLRGGLVVALLGVGNKPFPYVARDTETVQRLADLAWEVAERKRAEAALRESEQRFRTLFEAHSAVMLLVRPEDGGIEDANAAAAAYYGYEREALRRMKIWEINTLHPDEVLARARRTAEGQRNLWVFPHRLASGEVRRVEVHSTKIDVGGRALLFSIVHDLGARPEES